MAIFETKFLFLAHGVLGFLFGVGFMVIPTPITQLMGLALGNDGITLARICGVLILGLGMIAFSFREESHSNLRQNVILAFIVVYSIMTLFNLLYFDLSNLMVWFLILLHAAFVAVYGYVFMKSRSK